MVRNSSEGEEGVGAGWFDLLDKLLDPLIIQWQSIPHICGEECA